MSSEHVRCAALTKSYRVGSSGSWIHTLWGVIFEKIPIRIGPTKWYQKVYLLMDYKGWTSYNCCSNIIGLVTDCTDWSTLHHFPLCHLTQSIDRKIVLKEGLFFCSDKGSIVSQTSLTLLHTTIWKAKVHPDQMDRLHKLKQSVSLGQIEQIEDLRFTLTKWTDCASWSTLCHLDRLYRLKA